MLVSLLWQLTYNLISYLDRRAVAHDHPGLFLQSTQFIVQSIILQIAHDLCIFHIIFLCSIVELLYKFFNSGYLAIIVIATDVIIFFNIFTDIATNIFHTHPTKNPIYTLYYIPTIRLSSASSSRLSSLNSPGLILPSFTLQTLTLFRFTTL